MCQPTVIKFREILLSHFQNSFTEGKTVKFPRKRYPALLTTPKICCSRKLWHQNYVTVDVSRVFVGLNMLFGDKI